ncbi:MAG TPA: DUF805 domain-containing protein [Blastocatellia bacterium]|nr:DUF805 domain-containing protein [Blastocatellia bacterium]
MRKRRQAGAKLEPPRAASAGLPRNWILGLVLAATFLAFSNTLFHGFAYDDQTFILQNSLVRSLSNIPTAFTKELWFYRVLQDKDPNKESAPTTPYYRPMFAVFQMVCWQLFQDRAPGWHLFNVLIHMLVVYFGFLILERITGEVRVSALASLLFAVHPLRSESVAWICGISDPFLAAFLLPSFYLYMLYRDGGKTKHLVGALALFLFGSFAKEPAIALPMFIAVYEVFIMNSGKRLVERLKPAAFYGAIFTVPSILYFAMRYYALGFVLSDPKYVKYPLHQILLTIPIVIWKYIGLSLFPFRLSIFHETLMVTSPLDLRFIAPVVGLAALAVGFWRIRSSPAVRFGVLWFAVHLIPVLNIGAFGQEFLVQERYVYIPSFGFSLLIAMAITRIPVRFVSPRGRIGRSEFAVAFLALVLTAMVFRFSGSANHWMAFVIGTACGVIYLMQVAKRHHDLGETGAWLWLQFVPIVGFIQAVLLMARRGDRGTNRYGEDPSGTVLAARLRLVTMLIGGLLLITSVALFPVKTWAQNAVWKDDMTLWKHGAQVAADQKMSHFILGHKYLNLQEWDNVVTELESFMKLDARNIVVISNLAAAHLFVYEQTKDRAHVDRSIALCEKGLNLRSDFAPLWDTLGRSYTLDTELRNYARAREYFIRGLRTQPENAMINFHLGAAYSMEGQTDEALRYLELARKLEPNLPDVHKFLGYTYRGRGRNRDAVESFNAYLALVARLPDNPEKTRVVQDLDKLRAEMKSAPPQE